LQKREGEKPTKFATKEMRAQDAALAMKEYQAERLAIQARTARLRALRLAKEAGTAAQGKTVGRRQGKSPTQTRSSVQ
jgi:hypothetical protein